VIYIELTYIERLSGYPLFTSGYGSFLALGFFQMRENRLVYFPCSIQMFLSPPFDLPQELVEIPSFLGGRTYSSSYPGCL
jgi:hypothetical protein